MLVSLSKNSLPGKGNWSGFGKNYPTLCFMIHSRRIFFEILWHNAAQYIDKSNVSQFSKRISFWSNMVSILSKVTQLALTAQEIFRNILAYWSPIVKGNLGKNYATLRSAHSGFFWIYVEWWDIKYQFNVGQLFQQITFWWTGSSPILARIMQPCLMIYSLRLFLKYCCKMEHDRHTKTINFPRKYTFGEMGKLGPIWVKTMQLL